MLYNDYHYLYPPRPEYKVGSGELPKYDNGEWIAQPKYNGACCNVYMNDKGFLRVMGREGKKDELSRVDYKSVDFLSAYSGSGWMVISGEFLNKNKKDEYGKPFNHKFIAWDLLVYNSFYLIGTTLEERLYKLEELYPCNRMAVTETDFQAFDHICTTGIKGVYKAPTYENNFPGLYQELIKTDLYEGLVIKKRDGKLQFGYNERNNHQWQFKCRKPTANYHQ